jgi:parvulin-like peptidyl-prolyl isomerase
LVKTKEEAEDILKQIQAGKDFQELAKTKSISPSASKGGDLGYFNKGDFDSKIEQIIASLKIDEVSAVITTDYGFNIFKRIK